MNGTAELVINTHDQLGEGPVWDVRQSRIDWVDITGKRLHRYDPKTEALDTIEIGEDIGAFAHRDRGGYVLALRKGFALMEASSRQWRMVAEIEPDRPGNRMNDGKCDRAGRFWAGSLAYDARRGAGSLYRFDPDGRVHTMLRDLGIANGLDWTADDHTMYFIDSFALGVDVYDFDVASGGISNRRRVVDVEWDESTPAGLSIADGMTLDAEGHLWVAIYGKGEVRRYSSQGELELTVDVGVAGVTSCAFGGDDFQDLYITTALQLPTGRDATAGAGGLYRYRSSVRGRPAHRFRG